MKMSELPGLAAGVVLLPVILLVVVLGHGLAAVFSSRYFGLPHRAPLHYRMAHRRLKIT
jgi:hypothetical protein